MFAIFDGIHNVGKTTLIDSFKQLSKVNFNVFKGRRTISDLRENSKNVNMSTFAFGSDCAVAYFSAFSNDINIMFDRLHLSEYAYGQVMRDMDKSVSTERYLAIDECLSKQNVKLIYLNNTVDTILNRMKHRSKQYNYDETIKIKFLLDDAYSLSKLDKIELVTDIDTKTLTEKIVTFLNGSK